MSEQDYVPTTDELQLDGVSILDTLKPGKAAVTKKDFMEEILHNFAYKGVAQGHVEQITGYVIRRIDELGYIPQ